MVAEESLDVQLDDLRAALDAWDDPDPGAADDPPGHQPPLGRDQPPDHRHRYAEASGLLPPLLHRLYTQTDRSEPTRAALHDAYRFSAAVVGGFRQTDLPRSRPNGTSNSRRRPMIRTGSRSAPSTGRAVTPQRGDYAGGLQLLERAPTRSRRTVTRRRSTALAFGRACRALGPT